MTKPDDIKRIYKIEGGLYQTGTLYHFGRHFDKPEEVTDVIWLSHNHPASWNNTVVHVFAFDDEVDGLTPLEFHTLKNLCTMLSNSNVMTVCDAGLNRSGLATTLVLVARGMNKDCAIAKVRRIVPNSLCNPGFVKQIRDL